MKPLPHQRLSYKARFYFRSGGRVDTSIADPVEASKPHNAFANFMFWAFMCYGTEWVAAEFGKAHRKAIKHEAKQRAALASRNPVQP